MQNDERDTPDSPSDEPPSQPPSDEANEFETASWPAQDAGLGRARGGIRPTKGQPAEGPPLPTSRGR